MFTNIGVAGGAPSVYLPNDANLDDIFLDYSGQGLYPVRDTGYEYTANQDLKWSFAYNATIGQNVEAGVTIDRVDMSVFATAWFGQPFKVFFKTGGVKYYIDTQSNPFNAPDLSIYGGGGIGNGVQLSQVFYWPKNPATNLPWTTAQVTAGEFGVEITGVTALKTVKLYGAYVQVWWGWNGAFGNTNGVPSMTPTADAPCGQSATLAAAFTNYDAKILEVSPRYGPLAGGTEVIIRGYNFEAGATIDIGGLAATGVKFLDSQHYLATVPAHAVGFADVVINESLGTSLVYKNGFQYTLFTRGEDIRRTPGVNINLGLNSGANSCSFTVDGDSNPPRVGEKIQILDEFVTPKRLLFAGNVQSVEQVYEGLSTQLAWNVSAVDFTWLLNRRRPFGEYHNMSASAIVKDLINKYAPGFTSNFVQTNLAKISIAFDGSWDLQTCLSVIARMIGGGHWYVDFAQDVHFFHIVPPDVNMPTAPSQTLAPAVGGPILRVGPGSAPVVAQGAVMGNLTFSPGIFYFAVTFVYDNGTESSYGPATAVALDGTKQTLISSIAIGAAVGTLTVVKRRIYYKFNGIYGGGTRYGFAQVDDNTTTAVTFAFTPQGTEIAGVTSMIGRVAPPEAAVASPAYQQTTIPNPSLSTGQAILCQPEYRPAGQTTPMTWSAGAYRFRVADIYSDLTESVAGPASVPFQSDGSTPTHLDNIPVGATVNGVAVIARRIYAALGTNPSDGDYMSWWVVPNNTETTANVYPTTGNRSGAVAGVQQPAPDVNPVWPNDDGPFLEGFDRPDDVTDDNPDLMRDPQVTSTVDLSQIRNRIQIRGGGSSTSDTVAAGSSILPITDLSFYSTNGGQVFIEGQIRNYVSISTSTGAGSMTLDQPIGEVINSGAPVALYLMVEDKVSQEDIGRVELDFNGHPTDGIHEFVIVDTSLQTPSQMFMRGMAELELYARPITSVRYSTRDPKTRPGAKVTINLTNPPISGEFLIQSVTIDQIHNEVDEDLEPRYNVTTSSNKFDLNDLFFQWNIKTAAPAAGAGGGTGASPQPSAPSEPAQSPVATGVVPSPGNTNMWTGVSPASGIKVDQVWASGSNTALSYVTDQDGYWMRMSFTSTGEGGETTQMGIPSNATFRCDQGFLYSMFVRIDQYSAPGDQIMHVGLFDAVHGAMSYDGHANGNNVHVNDTRKFIGFRLGGAGWAGLVGDGVTINEYAPGFHAAQPYGIYRLGIRVVSPAMVATPAFGAFYKSNFPGGVIELDVTQGEETTNGFTLRIPMPTAQVTGEASFLTTGWLGYAKLYNGQYPGTSPTKTFDINTANGAYGNGF